MSKYIYVNLLIIGLVLVTSCGGSEPTPANPAPTAAVGGGLAAAATATNSAVDAVPSVAATATPERENAPEATAVPETTADETAVGTEPANTGTTTYQDPIDITQKKCKRLESITFHTGRQTIFGLNDEGLICELDPQTGEVLSRHSIDEDDPAALTADTQSGMLFVAAEDDGDFWEIDPDSYEIIHKYEIKFTLNEEKIADKKDIETIGVAITADGGGNTLVYLLIEIDGPENKYNALVETILPTEKLDKKMDLVLNNVIRFEHNDFRGLHLNNESMVFSTINKETLELVQFSAAGEPLPAIALPVDKPDGLTRLSDGTIYVSQKEGLFKHLPTGISPVETTAAPEAELPTAESFPYQPSGELPLKDCDNISGVVYHLERGTLFVINDNGTLCEIDPLTETVLQENKVSNGDIEGLTYNPATGLLYIAEERDEAIIEVDPNTLTAIRKFEIEREFNGQTVLRKGGQGVESIEFVPDVSHPEGGTFFLTNQSFEANNPEDASAVFEVALPLSQPVTEENPVVPILNYYPMEILDLAGLYYDATADLLYVVSDDTDQLIYLTRTGQIVAIYPLPGDGQEGITIGPDGMLYISEDLGGLTLYQPIEQ